MITADSLVPIGVLGKPHGVKGEISATLSVDADLDELDCIVLDMDGIYVPFYLDSVRPKSADTDLVTIDGFNDEIQVSELTLKTIYAFRDELDIDDDMYDPESFVGYEIYDTDGRLIGVIDGIDTSTANILFVVSRGDSETLIPAAADFVTDISPDARQIVMQLPDGLLDL